MISDIIHNIERNPKDLRIVLARVSLCLCKLYNKEIKLPNKFGHEKLYRNDRLYDLILVLNYNVKPIKKNKGSAIFIHVSKNSYKKTQGCIALKKKHLITLASQIKKSTKIKIG